MTWGSALSRVPGVSLGSWGGSLAGSYWKLIMGPLPLEPLPGWGPPHPDAQGVGLRGPCSGPAWPLTCCATLRAGLSHARGEGKGEGKASPSCPRSSRRDSDPPVQTSRWQQAHVSLCWNTFLRGTSWEEQRTGRGSRAGAPGSQSLGGGCAYESHCPRTGSAGRIKRWARGSRRGVNVNGGCLGPTAPGTHFPSEVVRVLPQRTPPPVWAEPA